jgi:hypothetical protein
MSRTDVLQMIKHRARAAALPFSTCCHTFRATGITYTSGLQRDQQVCERYTKTANEIPDTA